MLDLRKLSLAALLLAVAHPAIAEEDMRTISGQLSYPERIALTPESIAVVEFRTGDAQQVQAQTRFSSGGRQVPLPFALQVPADTAGSIRGAIWSAGRPAWVSDSLAIEVGDDPLEVGTLALQPFSPKRHSTVMRCGQTEVQINLADDHAQMRVDDETFALFPLPAASGAKFAAQQDPDTFFWAKGNHALVSLAGNALPECEPAVPVEKTSFVARGNEPGWRLEISGDQLQLSLDYGTREISDQLPTPVSTGDVRVYQLPEQALSIRISDHLCSDSMTGMPYPSTVALEVDDQRLTGCGGDPRALLEGPEWTVKALAGEPLPGAVKVTINFLENDRVAGSSGCNRFMGGYQLSGEGLSFSPIATTRMACPEAPKMQIEQRFLGLLRAVIRFEITPSGELLLITAEDERIRAER